MGFAAKAVHFWRSQQVAKVTQAKDVNLSDIQAKSISIPLIG
jgi:hypothetical protein